KRNLISAEIVEQLYILSGGAVIDNIVLKGRGEPLLNLTELRRALAVILDGFSPRRVTLSTCGIIPGILALANEGPAVRLALSVPSAREELRERLVPFCAKYPLADLKAALARWQALRGQRITVETALLGGINTAKEDAAALAAFVSGLEALVNIIPWNPADGLEFEGRALRPPEPCETANFMRILKSLGVKAELRRKKGGAVCGACGQLGVTEAGSPKN
ncbi:MAG: 23S rRNA (adenine(2503)-C2)-methyltransferase, partial [Spirochaetaceae bacterium]|nr:23S rRNA (adenine(2503)-C2)-methyltransferase [Spirochaetaceae bacterium]